MSTLMCFSDRWMSVQNQFCVIDLFKIYYDNISINIWQYRAKNDMWNGITGGCLTGVMLAARSKWH